MTSLVHPVADAFGDDPWIRQLLSLIQHVYNKYPNVKLFGKLFGVSMQSYDHLNSFIC